MLYVHLNKDERGSAAIEAAIVFPVVIIIILIIIFSFLKLYLLVCIQSVINDVSVSCNRYIINEEINIDTGYVEKDSLIKPNIYWRIVDVNQNTKEERIKKYVDQRLKTNNLVFTVINDINTYIDRYGIGRKLRIEVKGQGLFPKLIKNRINTDSNFYVEDKSELLLNNDIVNTINLGILDGDKND